MVKKKLLKLLKLLVNIIIAIILTFILLVIVVTIVGSIFHSLPSVCYSCLGMICGCCGIEIFYKLQDIWND